MTQPKSQHRYYPTHKDRKLHDDFRVAYDHIYALQDRLAAMEKRHSELTQKMNGAAQAGGASTTKIAGLYVIGKPPADGQKLTYVSATGQIEWK